jgi:hypothetical protein
MKIVVFLTFVLSSISGAAQIETSVEVKGMVNYALPLGELGQVYKKAPNYQMGFAKSKCTKRNKAQLASQLDIFQWTQSMIPLYMKL